MATTAAMITDIQYELKDTGGTNYTDAELMAYINEGVRHIMRQVAKTWPDYWLNTGQAYTASSNLVADTANYDLPAGFFKILMVVTTDSSADDTVLEAISLERSIDSDADGYLLMNNDIYIYPTPDTNVTSGLTIYYIVIPTEVAADETTVPLSDMFEDWIREYAVLKCKVRQEDDPSGTAAFTRRLQEDLLSKVTETNRSQKDAGLNVYWRKFI